jgi:two-component system LytT family response regulator
MKVIRALIADDESLARSRLKRLLRVAPQIEIIGECSNGKETIRAIQELSPDALFLDIQMPEMNGFQVLESIRPEKLPHVIFVTAYDQYALKAFEFYALDYLLKPFNEERILRAVKRLREKCEDRAKQDLNAKISALLEEMHSSPGYIHRLMIRENHRSEFIRVKEIRWIQAERKCVRIHLENTNHFIPESLQDLERILNPKMFLRCHRSIIVNLNFVKEVRQDSRPGIILLDGTELPIGRTFQQKLFASLQQLE